MCRYVYIFFKYISVIGLNIWIIKTTV